MHGDPEERAIPGFSSDSTPPRKIRLSSPLLGQFKKAGMPPFKVLREFSAEDSDAIEVGQEIRADIFNPGDMVKVIGTSKGKGFAGVMKKMEFWRRHARLTVPVLTESLDPSDNAHGPPACFKGKKLPGRMGGARVTAPSVKVVEVRPDENLIFLKGPIPGARGAIVLIRKS